MQHVTVRVLKVKPDFKYEIRSFRCKECEAEYTIDELGYIGQKRVVPAFVPGSKTFLCDCGSKIGIFTRLHGEEALEQANRIYWEEMEQELVSTVSGKAVVATLAMEIELWRRTKNFAIKEGKTLEEIVDEAIRRHLGTKSS